MEKRGDLQPPPGRAACFLTKAGNSRRQPVMARLPKQVSPCPSRSGPSGAPNDKPVIGSAQAGRVGCLQNTWEKLHTARQLRPPAPNERALSGWCLYRGGLLWVELCPPQDNEVLTPSTCELEGVFGDRVFTDDQVKMISYKKGVFIHTTIYKK